MAGRAPFVVYADENVILDFVDPDGDAGSNAAELAHSYFTGPVADQVFAQENFSAIGGSTVLWQLTDNLGSVRDLVDNAGTPVAHFDYDAFGVPTTDTLTAAQNVGTRYLYTAREYDAVTGLQYNRARWYDPVAKRWLSLDPIGFQAGDTNLYRYVGNNPTNAVDPSGLDEVTSNNWWFSPGPGDAINWTVEGYRTLGVELDYGTFQIGKLDDSGQNILLENGALVSLKSARDYSNRINTAGNGTDRPFDNYGTPINETRKSRILGALTGIGNREGLNRPTESTGATAIAFGVGKAFADDAVGILEAFADPLGTASNFAQFFGRPLGEVERDLSEAIFEFLDQNLDSREGHGRVLYAGITFVGMPQSVADDAVRASKLGKLVTPIKAFDALEEGLSIRRGVDIGIRRPSRHHVFPQEVLRET